MKYYRELSNSNSIALDVVKRMNRAEEENHFAFKIVFNGHQDFYIQNRSIFLYPDSFLLLTPGTRYQHEIESDEPVKTLSISITEGFLKDFQSSTYLNSDMVLSGRNVDDIVPFQSTYPLKGDMWFNILHLKKEVCDAESDEMLINEYLHHCLLNYYRLYREEIHVKMENLNFVQTSTKTEIMRRLSLAKEYISNNYNKKFRLEDIASESCLSVNHLLRTFKQAFGISPYQYLTFVRLNRSRTLLEVGQYSVNEIAFLVGFESVSSFIRLFKATFSYTPLKFKKRSYYH